MGVAVRVRTSTVRRQSLSFSFWRTPKRCSSSTIGQPQIPEGHIFGQQPVGADEDVHFALGQLRQDAFLLRRDLKRLSTRTSRGKWARRLLKVS